MATKSSRIVYKIELNDLTEEMKLNYYQYLFMDFSINIPYSQLDFKYQKKSYGIGNILQALILLDSKRSIADISEKNTAGWSSNDLNEIIPQLVQVFQPRNLN